jgi:hypothetical protein
MNNTLPRILATTAALWGLGAYAATDPASAPLSSGQAKAMKTQSDAQYKANKDKADANYELNKAKCETTTTGSVKSACKDDAKAEANKEKADAKVINKTQNADTQSQTK